MASAYIFNMTLNTCYLNVNNTQPQLTINALNNTSPYSTLGTPATLTRVGGETNPMGTFGDQNQFNWSYGNDPTPRTLKGVGAPTSFDTDNDVQVYLFKNSAMVRYGDDAVYFSPSGSESG